MSIFYYLKTGKLLQEKDDYKNLNVIFGDENLENIWGPSELSIQAMLRMLVLIFDKLNSNVFFFSNSIQKIPYVFNNLQDCNVNFNPTTYCFEIFNLEMIKINGFSSIKIHFEFTFAIDQLVIYISSLVP